MPVITELTPKQKAFCDAILDNKNYTEAYTIAYKPDTKKQKPETINRRAYDVYHNGKVQARINEVRGKIEAKLIYTAEQSFNKLSEIQQKALEFKKKIYTSKQEKPIELDNPDFKSAVKAEELKGKLTQLYTDKSEVNHSGIIVLNFDSEDKKA